MEHRIEHGIVPPDFRLGVATVRLERMSGISETEEIALPDCRRDNLGNRTGGISRKVDKLGSGIGGKIERRMEVDRVATHRLAGDGIAVQKCLVGVRREYVGFEVAVNKDVGRTTEAGTAKQAEQTDTKGRR
jgi:hypothetical protein